jgi:hypothetical protein
MILWLAFMVSVEAPNLSAAQPAVPRMRKARDPEIAVCEEFAAARAKRTRAAYDLFIARHPEHRLAKAAREERDLLLPSAPPKR